MHAADPGERTLAQFHGRPAMSSPARRGDQGGPGAGLPMWLTTGLIKAKSPCVDGFRWYLRHHAGGGDYQQVLDALVAAGRVGDACWLLDQFGPTNAVLQADAIVAGHLVFAGTIVARRGIEVDGTLRAGRAIRCEGSIRAGTLSAGSSVRAAAGIRCDGALEAGEEVEAGWGIATAGKLQCGGHLRARRDLVCGGALQAGGAIAVGGDLLVEGQLHGRASLQAGGLVRSGEDIGVAQGLLARGAVECGRHLEAGWGIKAADGIAAQGSIRAGESLATEGEIRAGAGYGVFAGLSVRRDAWECSARVSARIKPDELMSGWWVDAAAPRAELAAVEGAASQAHGAAAGRAEVAQ